MEQKEIKIKIDTRIYNRAKEYNIDISEFLSTELHKRVIEISDKIAREKEFREYIKREQERTIIKIIKRISKNESKFNYASLDSIIAKAEQELIYKDETINILNRLVKNKEIYQPINSNYRVTKVKPR